MLGVTGGSDAVTVEPNSVAAVDPDTGQVEAAVPIGGRPTAIAVGEGAVWVANPDQQTLVRIDPKTKAVTSIGLGTRVADVAVGFGSVWVAGGNGETLTRIDPKQNVPEASIDLGGGGSGVLPRPVFLVATGAGSVWATRGNTLLRIDPDTNEARTWLTVNNPQGLVAGRGAVWVTQLNEHVLRIDTTTPKITCRARSVGARPVPRAPPRLALVDRLRGPEAARLASRLDHARTPGRRSRSPSPGTQPG